MPAPHANDHDLTGAPMLKSSAVMRRFGYQNRASFWEVVKKQGVPHVRLNKRRIMFGPALLNDWIRPRSAGGYRFDEIAKLARCGQAPAATETGEAKRPPLAA